MRTRKISTNWNRAFLALFFCAALVSGGAIEKLAGSLKRPQTANHGRAVHKANIPLAPFSPPRGLHAQLDVRGVYLIWENEGEMPPSSMQFDYRIYRREKGSPHAVSIPYLRAILHTREGERWTGVDTTFKWEKTYLYSVRPVTRVYSQSGKLISEIEGDETAAIEITTHDIFPPAIPERLLAVVTQFRGKNFVDLLWAPNVEKDIAGYNVYRREENGEAARINSSPVTILSLQDLNALPAHTYFYSISAIDKHGNESARSQEAKAMLQ